MVVTETSRLAPTSLVDVFKMIDSDSCPYRYNFHLHTRSSDGQLSPELLMQQAVSLELEGLAITDHHSIDGYQIAQQWLHHQPSHLKLPTLWAGVEITASLAATDVHILAYDFNLGSPVLQPYLQGERVAGDIAQAEYVIDAIHASQGLAVLAHPARYKKSAEELVTAAVQLGIDGLETYYCYTSSSPWTPSPAQTRLVRQLSEQYELLQTCGTDTHGLDIQRRR